MNVFVAEQFLHAADVVTIGRKVRGERMPDLTIIIPQFGRSELTTACVRSVRRCELATVPVLVVDDGSAPEHRAAIRDLERIGVRLIEQPRSGITAAWNRGLAAVESEFVVFLNNDVVAGGPFLDALVQPLRDSRTAIAGSRLRREVALPRNVLERLPGEWFLEGWCLAARTDDLRRIGGFDERMRLYFSDTDMQARLLRKHGCGIKALSAVTGLPLRHLRHATTRGLRDRRRQWVADRAKFIEKMDCAGSTAEVRVSCGTPSAYKPSVLRPRAPGCAPLRCATLGCAVKAFQALPNDLQNQST